MFGKKYDKKMSNLMVLDNSGIDYSGVLLFVFCFLFYWKIEPNSRVLSRLRQHLVYDLSKLSKKQNVTSKNTIFKLLLQ